MRCRQALENGLRRREHDDCQFKKRCRAKTKMWRVCLMLSGGDEMCFKARCVWMWLTSFHPPTEVEETHLLRSDSDPLSPMTDRLPSSEAWAWAWAWAETGLVGTADGRLREMISRISSLNSSVFFRWVDGCIQSVWHCDLGLCEVDLFMYLWMKYTCLF